MLTDTVAEERAVISGIYHYGSAVLYDISDLGIDENTFLHGSNAFIFQCLKTIITHDDSTSIDIPSIVAIANRLDLGHWINDKTEKAYLQAIINFQPNQGNVRKFAVKLKKLQIARQLQHTVKQIEADLEEITGDESITAILGTAESKMLEFAMNIDSKDEVAANLGTKVVDHIQYLVDNPVDQVGLPTGIPPLDRAIGGGLRPGLAVIGARQKEGKSILGDCVGRFLAENHNIPVLNVDTELDEVDHLNRLIAAASEVEIQKVETGQFGKEAALRNRVFAAGQKLNGIPFHHRSVRGKSVPEILSIMRRWIITEVGLNADGTAKPCMIIYDWIQLMDVAEIKNNLAEHQLLGFLIKELHDFAKKYQVPFLVFSQLNRDGIDKESSGVVRGSDRIMDTCTSFTIFKPKSDEEIGQDGPEHGNKKLVTIFARYGPGMSRHQYINMHFKGWCTKITPGQANYEVTQSNFNNQVQEQSF